MNPMTNTKNIKKLSEQELQTNFKTSWHDQYKNSAWIFVGGLPYDLSEGDLICVFSQYGEIVNINLIRDKLTGKQKGFCFICFEDQRSTALSVDNLNGIKILGRTIRVDHVSDYKAPKDHKDLDPEVRKIHNEGCAPHIPGHDKKAQLPTTSTFSSPIKENELPPDGFRLPPRLPIGDIKQEDMFLDRKVKIKKEKKHKKEKSKRKKSKKKHKKRDSSGDSSESSDNSSSEGSDREEDKKRSQKRKSDDRRDKDEGKRHRR